MKNNKNEKITLSDFIMANILYDEIKEKEEAKSKEDYEPY